MYHTLIMLKPNSSFTIDDLHEIVDGISRTASRTVRRDDRTIEMTAGDGSFWITENHEPYVLIESNEIAERFGVPSQGCRSRFEMYGDDPDMELFNDYLLINERLQTTGQFVIFDTEDCKLLFDE